MKILFICFAILGLMACQKEIQNEISACKLATLSYTASTEENESESNDYTISYEGDKILYMNSLKDSLAFTYNVYNQLTHVVVYDKANGDITFKNEYEYNTNGLLIQGKEYGIITSDLELTSTYTFTYQNGKRAQAELTREDGSFQKLVYNWTNDNITSIDYYGEGDTLVCTESFSYDATKESPFFSKIVVPYLSNLFSSPDDLRQIFFLSKNLPVNQAMDCSGENISWDYTFYSNNLLKSLSNGPLYVLTFGYSCQ